MKVIKLVPGLIADIVKPAAPKHGYAPLAFHQQVFSPPSSACLAVSRAPDLISSASSGDLSHGRRPKVFRNGRCALPRLTWDYIHNGLHTLLMAEAIAVPRHDHSSPH